MKTRKNKFLLVLLRLASSFAPDVPVRAATMTDRLKKHAHATASLKHPHLLPVPVRLLDLPRHLDVQPAFVRAPLRVRDRAGDPGPLVEREVAVPALVDQ